jgi:DNA-binding GntR family transcriptional regulator
VRLAAREPPHAPPAGAELGKPLEVLVYARLRDASWFDGPPTLPSCPTIDQNERGACQSGTLAAMSRDDLPDAFSRLRLERQSTPAQITKMLEQEILGGALRPGDRLREVQLAETFGVSRNTLREALHDLERDGLITHLAHRGAVVTKLTPEQVGELYGARAVLETAGLRLAAGSDDALADLDAVIERLERARRKGDVRELLESDFAFHRALVDQLGNPRLSAFFGTLQRELRLVLSRLDSDDPDPQVGEHREMLDALGNGRVAEAEKLLARHLEVARARVVDMLAADD